MNSKLLSILLLTLPLCGWTQNVIHVRGQHSKVHIYTLQEREFISRGESKILVKSVNGPDYEFIIQSQIREDYCCDFNYKLYKNSKLIGTTSYPRFTDDDTWYTNDSKEGVKTYTIHFKNGKSYGPYQSCYAVYDQKTSKIVGVWYRKDNQEAAFFFNSGKTVGPFKSLSIQRNEGSIFDYIYQNDKGTYLFAGGKTYGPYLDIRVKEQSDRPNGLVFAYQDQDEIWHISSKKEIPLSFAYNPNFHYDNDEKWVVEGTPVGGDKRIYFKEDQIEYCYDDNCRTYSNVQGDRIKIKTMNDKSIYSNPVEVFQNENKLGEFVVNSLYSNAVIKSNFFNCVLKKELANGSEERYLVNQNGLVGPLEGISSDRLYLVGNDYFYIRERDSALMMNGKETEHKGVIFFDYSKYPDAFYICKKAGIYDVFYKNNKQIGNAEIREAGFNPDWYKLAGNKYILEFKDEKYYAIPKGSSKRVGPVMRNSNLFFSKGNSHYAECDERRMEVYIDGKLISKGGFCLTYDATNNCFYWMSLADDRKMYLHTYLID